MKIRSFFVSVLLLAVSFSMMASSFVTASGGHLYRDGKPYYFIGTNLWYAPILASEGEGGNRERLLSELDMLHRMGVNNLRILVGADAGSANANSVVPYLQAKPGVLNDTLLAGLDYLLVEMGKRDMTGVFYLTNSWDWSGGYGYYLREVGYGDSPDATAHYNAYVDYAADFLRDGKARKLYLDFVERIVSRTNRYTGVAYKDDPTIMSWQICNEPRPFSKETKESFARWISETAKLIKRIAPRQLVSTGSEGLYGCEVDEQLCERIHNDPNVDYLTLHIWPINWRWATSDRLFQALPNVYLRSGEYIDIHERIARNIGKPMVIEEFGYARDNNFYYPGAGTRSRDSFYNFIFSKVQESKENQGPLAGCNFWGWGGSGRPAGKTWKRGNDYLCDPPHEPQGWYSVYDCDSTTLSAISEAVRKLEK